MTKTLRIEMVFVCKDDVADQFEERLVQVAEETADMFTVEFLDFTGVCD